MLKIVIKKEHENSILKNFIQKRLNWSSSKVGKFIDKGEIKVNNKKVYFNYVLKENDEIKIYGVSEKKTNYDFLKTKYNINIFYEDQNILIINKSRGIVCQEDASNKIETLNNSIKKYLYNTNQWDPNNSDHFVPNLCHRLDKYTIGLIIAAKNKNALIEINNALQNKQINKFYTCLVHGILKQKEAILKNYIMKNDKLNIMEIDHKNLYNKEIITKYKVIEEKKNHSKLMVQILTGKKHQIRVHLASINHPLLGDNKYNKFDCMGYKYPCLASTKIEFNFDQKSFLKYLNKKEFLLKQFKFV